MPPARAVEFHTGVAEPLEFACRLLRKAWRTRARALVLAPPPRLAALDRSLWTFAEREFIAHVVVPRAAGAAWPAVAARTPLWLCAGIPGTPGVDLPGLLVNAGTDLEPADLAPFSRVIEIVGAEPEEAAAGRARWRAYKVQGLAITHHAAAG